MLGACRRTPERTRPCASPPARAPSSWQQLYPLDPLDIVDLLPAHEPDRAGRIGLAARRLERHLSGAPLRGELRNGERGDGPFVNQLAVRGGAEIRIARRLAAELQSANRLAVGGRKQVRATTLFVLRRERSPVVIQFLRLRR